MKAIYKFRLPHKENFFLTLSNKPKLLKVAVQGDSANLWVELDPDNIIISYRFKVFMTGPNIDVVGLRYVDSFELPNGIVGHLYVEDCI